MFSTVRNGEVAKAAHGRAQNIASEPDGYPADTFKGLPQSYRSLAQLYAAILRMGNFPKRMLAQED